MVLVIGILVWTKKKKYEVDKGQEKEEEGKEEDHETAFDEASGFIDDSDK